MRLTNAIREKIRIKMIDKNFAGRRKKLEQLKTDVAEKRRQEVIRSKCKNVHAYLVGLIIGVNVDSVKIDNLHHYPKLSYNPYKYGYFYIVGEESESFKEPLKGVIWGHINHGIYYRE